MIDEKDKKIQELNDRINKAIDFYETYKQECVISRTKDEKLIKDYYLPAQLSKKLINILKGRTELGFQVENVEVIDNCKKKIN